MAATFNPALTTPKDRVRQEIGDTDLEKADVQDETIMALLAESGATPLSVAASLAGNLAAKYSRMVTYSVDGQGESYSHIAANYRALADDLGTRARKEAAGNADEDAVAASQAIGGGIMVGGINQSKNLDRMEDPERAANYTAKGYR